MHATQDSLTIEDIAECIDLFATVLRPGGHSLVFFYAAVQFVVQDATAT